MNPTPKQLDLLSTIVEFRDKHGFSPTIGELMNIHGRAKGTIQPQLVKLVSMGLLTSQRNLMRSYAPTGAGTTLGRGKDPKVSWPIAGTISAAGMKLTSPRRSEVEFST